MTSSNKKVLVVGISGVTCSGKTTIAKNLNKILPDSKIFCQDDYYFPVEDTRHKWIPELNHINFDIVSSLDMHKMTQEIKEHLRKESSKTSIPRPVNNAQAICFRDEKFANLFKIEESECHIVVVEGFCIFNYIPLAELCDLKYYFTLDYDECFKRRVKRVYEPPDCPGYFEKCAWPEHLQQLAEVKENVTGLVYFNGKSKNQLDYMLSDIVKIL